jgi:hypothetical protein
MIEAVNIEIGEASVETKEKVSTTCAAERNDSADYYMENGFVVFTETYHLKRGHCCRSGCRHCPYGFKRKG